MSSLPVAFKHRNLPLLLLKARECVITRFRPILNAHNITEQQWRVLRALTERGRMEPREMVTVCCLSGPSLAGVLARMDDAGLVARQRFEHDQRRLLVSLTPKSRALVARIAPQVEAIYGEIEAHIGAAFTQDFFAKLDELIGALGEPAGAPEESS